MQCVGNLWLCYWWAKPSNPPRSCPAQTAHTATMLQLVLASALFAVSAAESTAVNVKTLEFSHAFNLNNGAAALFAQNKPAFELVRPTGRIRDRQQRRWPRGSTPRSWTARRAALARRTPVRRISPPRVQSRAAHISAL